MSVSSQTTVNSSTGNGVTTVFPYTFKILDEADIEVSVDGVVKTLTTHYTVSGVGDDGGGDVTFLVAPANGTTVLRRRAMALVRTTDYQYQGDLSNDVLNDDQDAPVLMIQQVQEQVDRSIKFGLGDDSATELPATGRENTLIGFDDDGALELVSRDEFDAQVLAAANSASAAATSAGEAASSAAAAASSATAAENSEAQAAAIVLGNFLQSGTGAQARTFPAKVRETCLTSYDFGAIADGTSHPLSSRYASLAAAQVDYPFATSLTQEMDWAACQASLNAAPTGSVVRWPTGIYEWGADGVTTGNKSLTIQGDGYRANASVAFGNAAYANRALFSGTVIFSAKTSGVALDFNPTSSWGMHARDLALVGPGSGTSLGARVRSATPGSSVVGCIWWNIGVFNFYQGYQFAAVLNSHFLRLRAVGCTIGGTNEAYSSVGSNNNDFVSLETYFTGTLGFQTYDSAGCRFFGPLIQNMDLAGEGLVFDGSSPNNCNDHVVVNPFLEHGGVRDSIVIKSGRNIQLLAVHCAGRIKINGGTGHQLLGKSRFTATGAVLVVDPAAVEFQYDQRDIDLDGSGTISDSGTRSIDKAKTSEASEANFLDSAHAINTTKKYAGKVAWETTNRRFLRAEGANPTDRWYQDGTGFSILPGGGANGPTRTTGSGNPEGAIAAAVGSERSNTAGGSSNTSFDKVTGTGTTGWEARITWGADTTTVNLGSAAASINTTNKRDRKTVRATDNHKVYYASGSNATDPWYGFDGTTITPV